ncbi:hypothetical protein GCM10011403_10890 [Pseudohongiella nitratireducens]|uniref:HTH araC/xylS-type domain-containing protein n=1 Tax=Pseudohongiella nitratireducens TaxID=1768907 RepID=A0A917GS98_9GAMM|nr:AraC family transcriptional regulator [Pseudohongiella nitratireducens]GGG55602.1 hypothetical protein GCM10011403_10890 [Pseudohongiella nitratireducens]
MSTTGKTGYSQSNALWDFQTDSFTLPDNGGLGRLQKFRFRNDLVFYRSEFRVDSDCVIDTIAEDDFSSSLSSSMHVVGRCSYLSPDGSEIKVDSKHATLHRIKDIHTKIQIPGNQIIKHIGVSCHLDSLHEMLDSRLPGALKHFESFGDARIISAKIPITSRFRKLLTQAFTTQATNPIHKIKLESLALSIYAEVLEGYTTMQKNDKSVVAASPWELNLLEEINDHIKNNLNQPLGTEMLADQFLLSPKRLASLYKDQFDCSIREAIKSERMKRAFTLINDKGLTVKESAHLVGYNHVSNFTKAYRDFHGETPGRPRYNK